MYNNTLAYTDSHPIDRRWLTSLANSFAYNSLIIMTIRPLFMKLSLSYQCSVSVEHGACVSYSDSCSTVMSLCYLIQHYISFQTSLLMHAVSTPLASFQLPWDKLSLICFFLALFFLTFFFPTLLRLCLLVLYFFSFFNPLFILKNL